MTRDGKPAATMTDGVLAAFEPVYARLGSLGWSPDEVDRWEVWTVARFMGDESFDPVIRGSRGMRLPKDDPGVSRSGGGRMNPAGMKPRLTDPGITFTGADAR